MRSATLALAFAVGCAASPTLAQTRILVAPERAQAQAQDQAPAPQAPAKDEEKTSPEAPAQPPMQAQEPPPTPAKIQDRIPSQAQRQNRARPLGPGRYTFNRVNDGLLRLDNKSGKVAFCKPISTGWVCDAVPEERTALQKEIAQLRDEVATVKDAVATTKGEMAAVKDEVAATKDEVLSMKDEVTALKNEIAALRAPPPPPVPPQTVPPAPHSGKDGDAQIKLPTAEDVARARAFIADTWHRLVEMIENWQKDMLRKS
jgi:hypothetical protein